MLMRNPVWPRTVITWSALITCVNGAEWPQALRFLDEAGVLTSQVLGGVSKSVTIPLEE